MMIVNKMNLFKIPFKINTNDSRSLNQLQIDIFKYWFQYYADIYNNGFVTWADLEIRLKVS
jgi:hypothetical protein